MMATPFRLPTFDQSAPTASIQAEKSSIASCLGRFCTGCYTFQQLIFLAMITYFVANPAGVLFGLPIWLLLAFQAAMNLMLSLAMQCAYGLDADEWARFKSVFLWIIIANVVLHAGVTGILAVLVKTSSGEDQIVYEATLTVVGVPYFFDIIGFFWMAAPFYCVYSSTSSSRGAYQPIYYNPAGMVPYAASP